MIISTKKTRWNTCIFYLSLFSILFGLTACGGGGSSSSSSDGGGSSSPTTTISGSVQLSAIAAGAKGLKGNAFHAPTYLSNATVQLYNADRSEWFYPVAETTTNSSGDYTLSTLINSSENKNSDGSTAYTNGDSIPAGNYTIIAVYSNLDVGLGQLFFYVAVQPHVKNFSGTVTGNNLIAENNAATPAVDAMFGLLPNPDGTFGGPTITLSANRAIQVTFGMAMARLTVTNNVSITDDTSAPVAGTWKVSPDLRTATFYPSSSLGLNKIFTVTVPTSVKNIYGKSIPQPVTGQFLSAATDTTPPNAMQYEPTQQTGVPISSAIKIASNEALDINTFSVSAIPSLGDKPTVIYTGIGTNLSFPYVYQILPSSDDGLLQQNTDYAITVSGAKDMAGLSLTSITMNFKTGSDTTAPVTTASPTSGTFDCNATVTLTANEPAPIYYTTDGTTPTTSSTAYGAPITITTVGATTLKFFAKDSSANSETVKSETYTITCTPPDTTAPVTTASPATGTYASAQAVTLSANEPATIYYTTDGSTPTTSSTTYTTAINITSTTTLKFFARDTAGNSETVKTETYTISTPDTTAPVTTASPATGTYASAQVVTLSANEPAAIYYTTDGSTPTTSSTTYTTAINIASTTTLKFFARDTAGNLEAVVKTEIYTITIPTPNGVWDATNWDNSLWQ